MKRFHRLFVTLMLAAAALAPAMMTSCEDKPIDVIITDYGYTVSLEDIHMADGVYPECLIRLTDASGAREESVTVEYRIDDDPSLRIKVNGKEISSGSDITFQVSGTVRLTLPALPEGRHTFHLVLTNRFGKSVTKDLSFNVIRDKVWAKQIVAPSSLRLEAGAVKDTTASVEPADADILALRVSSTDSATVVATLFGEGAQKTLRVEPKADGNARLLLYHEDLQDPASVSVEVFSYKIGGLNDISVEEGKDVTFSLTAVPDNDISLSSSSPAATVTDLGNKTYKVTGVTPGTAILSAVCGQTHAEAVVTVTKKEESIAVSPMSATIAYGSTKMFSVSSSAEYRAELSSENASIVEMTSSAVTIRNDNRAFTDGSVTLTVINRTDENKKATADIKLDCRPETISLVESGSSEGRAVVTVSGDNGGWEVVSVPNGLRASVDDGDIILVNDTYKTISGKVSVKTRLQGVTASKEVSVRGLAVTLQSLRIEPSEFSIEVGRSVSMAVVGRYVDGSEQDVTNNVTWTQSSNLQRNGNNFTATAIGSAWVRASLESKSVQADGNVTMTVTELNIDPTFFNALVGDSKLFTVTAKYSNNTSRDVTRDCRYVITGGAKEAAKGYITMTEPGEVLVEAIYTYDGVESYATARGTVTKPVANVSRVEITPLSSQVKVGESVTFVGTVYYSDGSSDHTSGSWSVSDQAVLSGGSGTYVALKEGSATVMYSCSQYSATASVTVKGGGGTGGGDLTGIALSKTRFELAPGQVDQVSVVAHYSDGSVKEVTRETSWSSVNTSVAEVDRNGYVVARGEGETYITAEWSAQVAQLYVVVKTPVTLRSLEASPSSLSFSLYGSAQQVSLTALYSDGSTEVVTGTATWTSSNAQVATVQAGLVTPIKEGTCNIGASFGGKNISIPVTVGPAEIGSIEIMPSGRRDYTCTVGDSYELECIGRYKGAEMSITYLTWTANWSASPSGVVRLEDGASKKRVVAIGPGDAVISVEYQGLRDAVSVHVKAAAPTIMGIRLSPTSINMTPGGTYSLSNIDVRYVMSDGSAGSSANVSWSLPTSASSYATLSGTTLKIKEGVSNGATFTLEARTNDYQYKANLTVTVSAADWEFTGLSVDSDAKVYVQVGQTANIASYVTLYAVYHDKNGREADKKENVTSAASWQSLTTTAFEVRNNSQVYGKVEGNYAGDRGLLATYNTKNIKIPVQVTGDGSVKVTGVTISNASLSLQVGQSSTLTATVQPSNATNKAVSWRSSNTSVATVSNGLVTAKGAGEATVTVKTEDGGYESSCRVSVTAAPKPVTGVAIYMNGALAPGLISVTPNETIQLKAVYSPDDAAIESFMWTKSQVLFNINPNNAQTTTFSCSDFREGTVTVTVKDKAGNSKSATVNIKVETKEYDIVAFSDPNKTKRIESLEWDYDQDDEKTIYLDLKNVEDAHASLNGQYFKYSQSSNLQVKVRPDGKNNSDNERTGSLILKDSQGKIPNGRKISLVQRAKPDSELKTLTISATNLSINENGGTTQLEVSGKDQYNQPYSITANQVSWDWAAVSGTQGKIDISAGKVTGKNEGKVEVWAYKGEVKSNKLTITINHVDNPVQSISLSENSIIFEKAGETKQLTVSYNPSDADGKTVSWTSNQTSVATVSNGIIKAVGPGDATITAVTPNGKSATCKVHVRVPVSSISLSRSSIEFSGSNKSAVVEVSVQPANADNINVTPFYDNSYVSVEKIKTQNNVHTYNVTLVKDSGPIGNVEVKFQSDSDPNVSASLICTRVYSVSWSLKSGTTDYKVQAGGSVDVSNTIIVKTENGKNDEFKLSDKGAYSYTTLEVSSGSTLVNVVKADNRFIVYAKENVSGTAVIAVKVDVGAGSVIAGYINVVVSSGSPDKIIITPSYVKCSPGSYVNFSAKIMSDGIDVSDKYNVSWDFEPRQLADVTRTSKNACTLLVSSEATNGESGVLTASFGSLSVEVKVDIETTTKVVAYIETMESSYVTRNGQGVDIGNVYVKYTDGTSAFKTASDGVSYHTGCPGSWSGSIFTPFGAAIRTYQGTVSYQGKEATFSLEIQ